jgi:hypothetical protein
VVFEELRARADLRDVKAFNPRRLAFLQLVDAVGNGSTRRSG